MLKIKCFTHFSRAPITASLDRRLKLCPVTHKNLEIKTTEANF